MFIKFQKNINKLLLILILFTAASRLFRLDYPPGYIFDEVYHAFTAREILHGHKEAWEWWNTPPKGVAFEWTHPPLAKELMTLSMWLFHSESSWAWRLPGVIASLASIFFLYKIGSVLFNNPKIGLITAFIFSIDGLNFVQSRTGMNDAYLVAFILGSLYFFIKERYFYSAILFGLALASKWATVYLFAAFVILLFLRKKPHQLVVYPIIASIIYFLTYIPFFISGHSLAQFIELHKQMWWYHTNLKATHDYSSPAWSWPLNLYPVWYHVQYYSNNYMSNIFASGNPIIFWTGLGAIIMTLIEFIKRRSFALLVSIVGYFAFWLPWLFSPRIMFLYHYAPSVPFLSLALGYQLSILTYNKSDYKRLFIILGVFLVSFLILYPILTGIPIPRSLMLLFFHTNLTKNPFGG